jgi:hypothetical protein
MTFNIKALAITAGVVVAVVFLFVGLGNLIWESYGVGVLQLAASVYPGYGGPEGFGSVIVVTLWGLVDGMVWGAIFGWLYNTVLGQVSNPAPAS